MQEQRGLQTCEVGWSPPGETALGEFRSRVRRWVFPHSLLRGYFSDSAVTGSDKGEPLSRVSVFLILEVDAVVSATTPAHTVLSDCLQGHSRAR